MDWQSADGVARILVGDCLARLRDLPDCSVQCCVTSPPYWGLRDYGNDAQLGLESTPEKYVGNMVAVFREVHRILRPDGTLWLNLGDSYASSGVHGGHGKTAIVGNTKSDCQGRAPTPSGLKTKDLVGIPWSVAKALQQPYYTGRIKSECDRVWLAATIDAEGSICGFTHERKDDGTTRTGIHVTITNTNTRLLDNAFRIWPTSRKDHNAHGNGHLGTADVYRWIAHNVDEKRQLLCELYPHLIAKKKQAMLAWNFLEMSCEAKRLARTTESESVKEKRAWIVGAISRLNHFEDVDVPAWCIEPPSLHETGYYLRQDIIWHKPAPMPESVTDRCTKAHEYVFLLAKSERYFYDSEAVSEALSGKPHAPGNKCSTDGGHLRNDFGTDAMQRVWGASGRRNRRSVWKVSTKPYKGAHFATMPPDLVEPCILAGTSEAGCCEACGAPLVRQTSKTKLKRNRPNAYTKRTGEDGTGNSCANDVAGVAVETTGWVPSCECAAGVIPCLVLDPFGGSGTTVAVAAKLGRRGVCCELNPEYVKLAIERITPNLPSAKHPLLKGIGYERLPVD